MSGARPTLVLLHAFGAAGRSYAPLAQEMAADATILAPDLPGFGGAPDLRDPLDVAVYADWVEAGVGAAAAGSIVLGGWSMGGKIALALAARRPAWLRGLVLIAPSPPSPEPMAQADRRRQLDGRGDAELARASICALVAAHSPPAWIEDAVAARLQTSEAAWRWWLEGGSRETLDLGDGLNLPALVVVGALDDNLGEELQRRDTLPRLRAAQVAVLERCGHFVPLEVPGPLARRVATWLRELS